jgi:hypothetical protein
MPVIWKPLKPVGFGRNRGSNLSVLRPALICIKG